MLDIVSQPSSRVVQAFNLLLTILEKLSDENIWKSFLGERVVRLGQKYFGNDFVTLSLAFYIAPILRTTWENLVAKLTRKTLPAGMVFIKIYSTDDLYNTVSKYVFEHGSTKNNLQKGVAQYSNFGVVNTTSIDDYVCDDWSDYGTEDYGSTQTEDSAMKVHLLAPEQNNEELTYKGHKIKVEFISTAKANEKTNAMHEPEHIIVSMPGKDTKKLHVILQEWSDEYNKAQPVRRVHRSHVNSWRYDRFLPDRDLDSVHLCEGQKEYLLMDIQTFKNRSSWYKSRGIPHRRGYLFYGPPGSGKTSTIQAIANYLNYNLAILGSIVQSSNENLSQLVRSLPTNSILVIEDIDHLFESTGMGETIGSITMSGILNILDGIQSQEGNMIFMTCNNINKITPALLRPGRIDVKLKFDYAAPVQVRQSFWRFMGLDDQESLPLVGEDKVTAEMYAAEFEKLIPSSTVTTAEIQSFFIDLLLEANAENWTRDHVYRTISERVPKFLKKVDFDREQAKKHAEEKDAQKKK
ncbi:MAG: P-loop containing nucleoside triphosphate hydrolase protein [Benjaminiella poitrasii]|nr:MAG: P-loop containing nucleoside triphosphate hydrolase protein [Benjaminiella poitrasii]